MSNIMDSLSDGSISFLANAWVLRRATKGVIESNVVFANDCTVRRREDVLNH
jgi:hypothetical protein